MRPKGELNHWSGEHIKAIEQREYKPTQDWKPSGFWFDVDRDWYRWCKDADFRGDALSFRHRLRIADDARIVRLNTAPALMAFTVEYAMPHPILGRSRLEHMDHSVFGRYHNDVIDWPRVAGAYQGIIIAPYCYQLRMDLMWYYGWDCASGCVWDASVLYIDAVYSKGRKVV